MKRSSPILHYGVAVLAVALVLVLRLVLAPLITQQSPFLLLAGAVMIAAWFGGLGPGLLATALGTLVADYFFLPPQGSFTEPGLHALPLILFAVQGLVISSLTEALRTARGRAEASALEAESHQESLRRSEQRFRALVQHSSDVITVIDADGTIRYVSPAVERVAGYHPEDLVGKSVFDYVRPENLEEGRNIFAELLSQPGVHPPFEFKVARKDGSWSHSEFLVNNLLDDPDVRAVVINQRDMTERKEAEEALHKSEAGLAEAQRMANLGNWEWDVRTGEVFWSEEVFRIYGYQPSEIVPTLERLIELVHPDDRRQLREAIDGALYRDEPYDFEHRIVRPNGEERIVHRRAEVVRGEGGEPLKMVGTVQDITGRKQTERALSESEQRFRQLFEQSVDALFVHDEDGRFVDCNSQACRLLGYSREELLELSVQDVSLDILTEEEEERSSRERDEGTLWQRAMMGEPGTFALSHEEENVRKDGTTFPREYMSSSSVYFCASAFDATMYAPEPCLAP